MHLCTRSRRTPAPSLREYLPWTFPNAVSIPNAGNLFPSHSLQQRKATEWKEKVELLFGDMRSLTPPELADIIVSELLGSFGDNELSPECLDGAMRFLKRRFPPWSLRTMPSFMAGRPFS